MGASGIKMNEDANVRKMQWTGEVESTLKTNKRFKWEMFEIEQKQQYGDSPAAQVLKLPKSGLITYIRGPYNDSGPRTREEEEDKMRSRQKKKRLSRMKTSY
jgi:hypothetical protein